MKNLKQISASNPTTYHVIDIQEKKGNILLWKDKIEIIIDHKSKIVTRRSAYKFGLCSNAN